MKYDYNVIRSHRKSIVMTVSPENVITVRCPWEMSRAKLEIFLANKEDWLEKVVTQNAIRLALNDDVIEYRKIYVDGVKLPLIISDKNIITKEAVYVTDIAEIPKLFTGACSEQFIASVYKMAEQMKLYPADIKIKSYKGRWGCCDAGNNIVFNYVLFMLPADVRRYVVVHELCHTICHNHSDGFWRLVSEFEPDFKKLKKELQTYNLLITLY